MIGDRLRRSIAWVESFITYDKPFVTVVRLCPNNKTAARSKTKRPLPCQKPCHRLAESLGDGITHHMPALLHNAPSIDPALAHERPVAVEYPSIQRIVIAGANQLRCIGIQHEAVRSRRAGIPVNRVPGR